MRYFVACLVLGWTVIAGQEPPTLVITNVTVIDGTGAAPRLATVVIRGGTIARVSADTVPAGGQAIDGTGKFLIPGLWDMHVHLASRPEAELAERVLLPTLLANGIVGVRDMGGPLERVLALKTQVASGKIVGPQILTPGPFLDGPGEASPLFRRPDGPTAAASAVADLQSAGVDFLKVQAALDPATHRAIIAAARERKLTVAGHIPLSMTAEEVLASGQRSIEHISPALVGDGLLLLACSRSQELIAELRAIEAARATADAAAIAKRETDLRRQLVETYDPARARTLGQQLKAKDVWIVPTLIWSNTFRPLSKADDGSALPMDLVPAPIRARWLERRKAYLGRATDDAFAAASAVAKASAQAVRDLHAGGARVLAGTDSFDAFVLPGHSLHQELELLVGGGLSPAEALRAATSEAAAFRGVGKTEGTIEAGKRADLVVLDRNPLDDIRNTQRVHSTIVGGNVYDRAALDRLLDGVRAYSSK